MNTLPQNNLQEHLARYSAIKNDVVFSKDEVVRKFTFRKSLSLKRDRSNSFMPPAASPNPSPVNKLPLAVKTERKLNTYNNVSSQIILNGVMPDVKQKYICEDGLQSNVSGSETSISNILGDCSLQDDLEDFDLSFNRLGKSCFSPKTTLDLGTDDKVKVLEMPNDEDKHSFLGNKDLKSESSYVKIDLADMTGICEKDEEKCLPNSAVLDNACISKNDLQTENEDEDIYKRWKRNLKRERCIESDSENSCDTGLIIKKSQNLRPSENVPAFVPETQFPCFPEKITKVVQDEIHGKCSVVEISHQSPSQTVSDAETDIYSETNANLSNSITSSPLETKPSSQKPPLSSHMIYADDDKDMKVFLKEYSNLQLLDKSTLENYSTEELCSTLMAIKDLNYSLMSKCCEFFLEKNTILEKFPRLKQLLDIRTPLLKKYDETEKILYQNDKVGKKKSFKSTISSRLSSLYKQKYFSNCSLNTSALNPKLETTVLQSTEKLAHSPLFINDTKNKNWKILKSVEEPSQSLLSEVDRILPSNLSSSNALNKEFSGFNTSTSKSNNNNNTLHLKNSRRQSNVTVKEDTQQIIENIETEDFETIQDDFFDIEDEDLLGNNEVKSNDETDNMPFHSQIDSPSCSDISPRSVNKGAAGRFYGNYRDDGASDKFKGTNFPHSEEMLEKFRHVFGLQKFRHNQLEAINAALLNEDCFVLMPTGGGKSLCYQLPAVITKGVSVVVSPLLSLIQDQTQKLWSLGVPANHLSGVRDASSASTIYRQLVSREPGIKLLYVTPEKISASDKLMSSLEHLYKRKLLARFILDEAHCVSQWGHDFRPDYKRLKILRERFPGVPMMALTATATPRVRIDILHQLNMPSPKWFLQSFNRPNLKYEVRQKKGKSVIMSIIEVIKAQFKNMSGIVYCLSRQDCDNVAAELTKNGIKAISYHAGMENESRQQVQEMWINDKFKVVCATIAFGMGIDKPDVRFVIHHSIPKSIEGYYQESGRSGRDGETSWCILFYNYQDMHRIKRMVERDADNIHAKQTHIDNLYRMVQYCENKTDCRRVQILEYFGEIFNKQLCSSNARTACDNCNNKQTYEICDVTEDAKAIVGCIIQLVSKNKNNYTLNYFVDIFKGSNNTKLIAAGHDKLPLHGRGQNYQRSDAERLLRRLVLDGYLQENLIITQMDHAVSYVSPGHKAPQLMQGKAKVTFYLSKGSKRLQSVQPSEPTEEETELEKLTESCYEKLIEISKEIAKEHNMHYTNIINIEALRQMSREMPMTEAEMLSIPHVTQVVYEKYGMRFLDVTQRYGAERLILEAELAEKNAGFSQDTELESEWLATANYDTTESFVINQKQGLKRKRRNGGAGGKRTKKFWAKNKYKPKWNKNKAKGSSFGSTVNKGNDNSASNKKSNCTVRKAQSFAKPVGLTKNFAGGKSLGFLPVPQPQNKVSNKLQSRSFLPPLKISHL